MLVVDAPEGPGFAAGARYAAGPLGRALIKGDYILRAINRLLVIVVCASFLGVTGCGGSGSPTAPTPATSATIMGLVNGVSTAPSTLASLATSGLIVTIEGTDLSAAVDGSGRFRLVGVPPGNIRLRFSGVNVNASALLANVAQGEHIEIEVSVSGAIATIVSEVRSGAKISLCHRTDSGQYHSIEVDLSAEPAHRAHGDGEVDDRVPGTTTKVFGQDCQPTGVGVNLEKLTNGQDADAAPGPSIEVGASIVWEYVVTNKSAVALSSVLVVDDKGLTVTCPSTSIAIGGSMTCRATGTAALGPYMNLGTVTATAGAAAVTDADPSHYLGVTPDAFEPKVQLCHVTGTGSYVLIEVGISAEPAHRAHGDGQIGEIVQADSTKMFGPGCTLVSR
jgi:hypothetical protein